MRYLLILCAVCLVACGGRGATRQRRTPPPPVRYGYKIVNAYPHDTGAYTQGLFWHQGALYESTGEYGRSTLRKVELETGGVASEISLDDRYFAEGAALLRGNIYQLTWREGKAFVYDVAAFTAGNIREFNYKGEGWGLATDGEKLYMSDGTPNVTVRDPVTFEIERTIVVRSEGRPVSMINEMEWIEGKLWANVFMSEEIVIINPADGRVEGIVDLNGIFSQITLTHSTDVMNGIAYDPEAKRIFVTGKNWNRLFEIETVKQ